MRPAVRTRKVARVRAPVGGAQRGSIALVGMLVVLTAPAASGQCQRAKFVPDDGPWKEYFGIAVAIHGDIAVVGAIGDGADPAYGGAAYVFRRAAAAWALETKLKPPDSGSEPFFFGNAVALNDDTLFVGAPHADPLGPRSGAVYLFQHSASQWLQVAKLLPDDAEEYDLFGWAVAMSDGRGIIGAPHDGWGSAYVFERDGNGTWRQAVKLVASDGDSPQFASAVGIDGDIVVVGSPYDDDLGNYSGSAYIFERGAERKWGQTSKLLPSDGTVFWGFGSSVAVSHGLVLVGAPGADSAVPSSGAVYVFARSGSAGWAEVAKLEPSDPENSGWFGSSIDISGSLALVGAEGYFDHGPGSGSAYVLACGPDGKWLQHAKLSPADGAAYDWFGHAVALSGTTAVIGAYENDDSPDPGKAYVFAVGPDEDGDGVMDACEAPGDTNCDQVVNAFDIDPFVLALTDPAGYKAAYPDCTIVNADCNADGQVDAFDIDPFVALLVGE